MFSPHPTAQYGQTLWVNEAPSSRDPLTSDMPLNGCGGRVRQASFAGVRNDLLDGDVVGNFLDMEPSLSDVKRNQERLITYSV
jgi:hypothetical protein